LDAGNETWDTARKKAKRENIHKSSAAVELLFSEVFLDIKKPLHARCNGDFEGLGVKEIPTIRKIAGMSS
jgi:hypothetical protein